MSSRERRRTRLRSVTENVHQICLGPVNAFLLRDGRDLALVDTGPAGSAPAILSAVGDLGHAPDDLEHILLTHAHPDHVGSAAALVRATGARTWMHALDAPVAEGREGFRPIEPASAWTMRVLHFVLSRMEPSAEPVTIDHEVEDGQVLPFARGLSAVHAPGHTAGQLVFLWSDQGVLFAADTCGNQFGLGPPLGYEDAEQWRRSQSRVAGLDFEIACFGHGRPITSGAAMRFREKWTSP